MSGERGRGRVYLAVADLDRPQPEPFAVVAIYLDRPAEGGGVEGSVVSLHMTREEADRVAFAGNSYTETQQ